MTAWGGASAGTATPMNASLGDSGELVLFGVALSGTEFGRSELPGAVSVGPASFGAVLSAVRTVSAIATRSSLLQPASTSRLAMSAASRFLAGSKRRIRMSRASAVSVSRLLKAPMAACDPGWSIVA